MGENIDDAAHATLIAQVRSWLLDVIIGFNFCPFARREFDAERVRYSVFSGRKSRLALAAVLDELRFLDEHDEIETTLLIFADGWSDFYEYLTLLDTAQEALENAEYEGIYQLASFHPDYLFEGEDVDDASNCTNRSPVPIIHLLRESSIERAIASDPNVDQIPERNKKLAREKSVNFWQSLINR